MKHAGMIGVVTFLPVFRPETVLRPPGATPDFLARCIRCGRCAEACPYDSIRFLGIASGILVHTPYIDPLQTPCYLCRERGPDGRNCPVSEFLRCGEVCPTGALRRIVNDKETLSMVPKRLKSGTAVLDRRFCLAWQYNFCGECYFNCPLKDRALLACPPGELTVAGGIRPDVDPVCCIGCGMCTYVCPVRKNVAESVLRRDMKPSFFEERYGALVHKLLARSGSLVKLPAIRVTGKSY